jgi:hypothetical protein
MRFGIELLSLKVGNPKWPARLTGGSMIHAIIENKYSFNMRVSAKAMAIGRSRSFAPENARRPAVKWLNGPAIGSRYGDIFNPYLCRAGLSESCAPRSKHFDRISDG